MDASDQCLSHQSFVEPHLTDEKHTHNESGIRVLKQAACSYT